MFRLVALAPVCASAVMAAVPETRAQAPADQAFETIAELVTAKMREYFAIAMLTNAGSGWRLIQDVERAALQSYHGARFRMNQAISHRGLNETLPAVTPLPQQPDGAPYAGRYLRPMNVVIVRAEKEGLVVPVRPNRGDPQPDMPAAVYGPDRAVVTSGPEKDASIEFIRDANATVRWVRVTGRIARRVEEGTKP